MNIRKFFYARISTKDQTLERQKEGIKAARDKGDILLYKKHDVLNPIN